MKSITINGSKRESVGKTSTKALRNAGEVPCVLYGGDGPVHFSAPELAFSKLVYTANAYTVVIAINEKESFPAVLQDIQFHPVTDKILHIDFYQLFDDKKIAMDIPVRIVGNSIGVKLGGNLQRNRRKLTVKAFPKNLPDFLLADVSTLKLNDSITVADLSEESFNILHPDSQVVCQVKMSRVSLSIEEEEGEDELEEGTEGAKPAEGGEASKDQGETKSES